MSAFLAMALLAANVVVIKPVANIHSAPAAEADVVSQAIFGTSVGVLEQNGTWAKVRTPDGYAGWMAAGALLTRPKDEKSYASGGTVAQVVSLFANLYQEQDITKHQPLLTIPFGSRLEVVSEPEQEDRRWIELRLPDETQAWVQRGDVAINPGPLSIDQAITLAKRFTGLPYLWGGTSTFGYDCSGFTQMLFRQRGVGIPRDAAPQARWEGFRAIERSELEAGDLVFFGESNNKITHTGMYIGGGEFIHATAYQKPVIQISRLDDPHWSRLLVACRRLK